MQIARRLTIAALIIVALAGAASASTLEVVKKRGVLACGITQGLPGFASLDDSGRWQGFEVDFCRALAVAIFDDTDAVRFVPTSAKERFTALQSGEVDLLSRHTTWTFTRDVALGFDFVAISYYDGQGLMVRRDIGVGSALALSGATICANTGTTTELNVADYFRSHQMKYQIVSFEKSDEVARAYDAGRCDVYTEDMSALFALRHKLARPADHRILPEVLSKEPLGPLVRQGDSAWADVVRWSLFAMILGEELGVTSANVGAMKDSRNPEIRRLLGVEGKAGQKLALDGRWAARILQRIGNYGESYRRNVGAGSPLAIPRGLNALWRDGGLLYAPPLR